MLLSTANGGFGVYSEGVFCEKCAIMFPLSMLATCPMMIDFLDSILML